MGAHMQAIVRVHHLSHIQKCIDYHCIKKTRGKTDWTSQANWANVYRSQTNCECWHLLFVVRGTNISVTKRKCQIRWGCVAERVMRGLDGKAGKWVQGGRAGSTQLPQHSLSTWTTSSARFNWAASVLEDTFSPLGDNKKNVQITKCPHFHTNGTGICVFSSYL
jgi:hypothetical protein